MASDGAEYIGVSELAASVGEALSEIAEVDRRMKSGATEIPSERTIRFYLEKGLLPKPTKRVGQTLVFGRVHLLHLLVIKKLQADGVPLSAIPDILKKKGKSEVQLEELLQEDVEILRSKRDLGNYRRRTGHRDDSDMVVSFAQAPSPRQELNEELPEPPHAQQTPVSEAKSYLKSLLSRSPKPAARQPMQRMPEEPLSESFFSVSPPPGFDEPVRWTRHEPAIGVEINISDDYEAPADERGKTKLLEKLREILGL